jgi:hypothetical protein
MYRRRSCALVPLGSCHTVSRRDACGISIINRVINLRPHVAWGCHHGPAVCVASWLTSAPGIRATIPSNYTLLHTGLTGHILAATAAAALVVLLQEGRAHKSTCMQRCWLMSVNSTNQVKWTCQEAMTMCMHDQKSSRARSGCTSQVWLMSRVWSAASTCSAPSADPSPYTFLMNSTLCSCTAAHAQEGAQDARSA